MKRKLLSSLLIFIAVGCNQTELGTDLFEVTRDDAKCFETALLLQDAQQAGRLDGVTYAKGICYDGSVALDDQKSFYAQAVIINEIDTKSMYASYLFRDQNGFYIKNERGVAKRIGSLDTSFGQAAIKLAGSVKKQVALESDEQGNLVPVLILEIHSSSRI